jgi:2-oxoisovalerate dehydrogenase E1 component
MKGSTLTNGAETRTKGAAQDLLSAYRLMLLSRRIDDKEIQLKNQSLAFFQISGAGHEAVLIAAGRNLRAGHDWFLTYYRDRALALTLGVTPLEMLLGSVGSADDPASGGRQMPSHWSNPRLHIPSASSAVATQCLHGIGVAEAGRVYERVTDIPDRDEHFERDEVTLITIGEGSTSEGEFWEALSTACTRSLPVLFLVEDNGYAISTPVEVQTPGGDLSRVVAGFPGLQIYKCDGTDYLASFDTLQEAVAHVRSRRTPALVHAKVIRPYSHSLSDDEKLYKTKEERESEARRDPIVRLRDLILSEELASAEQLAELARDVEREVNAAAEQALAAPKPEPETAARYVFSPAVDPTSAEFDTAPAPSGAPDTMVAAINATLRDEMAHDPRIVVFGQDVADATRETALAKVPGKGGVFKVTHGLQKVYGSDRVFNSPLAEANIIGRAVGMALRGIKPVVEIQFFDYIWPGYMQLRDEMAMMRYRSNNHWSCPMVVRVPIGGYLRGGAPYHSQSGVAIFAHCPGIRIAFPSNAHDAAGLLRTAIRCDDPVMFLEHKHLYRQTYNKAPYQGPDFMIPFGKAAVVREGTDVVIFTWGALVQRAIVAAQQAERDHISVAVVDLRTIVPLDLDTIAAYTRKTNRVIVAHEDQMTAGFGGHIASWIGQELFDELDAPVTRVASLDCPVAYAPSLEEAILPGSPDVLKAIRTVAAY